METDAIASFAIAVVDSPVLQSNALFSSNEILPANVIFSIAISAIGDSIPCSITSVSPSVTINFIVFYRKRFQMDWFSTQPPESFLEDHRGLWTSGYYESLKCFRILRHCFSCPLNHYQLEKNKSNSLQSLSSILSLLDPYQRVSFSVLLLESFREFSNSIITFRSIIVVVIVSRTISFSLEMKVLAKHTLSHSEYVMVVGDSLIPTVSGYQIQCFVQGTLLKSLQLRWDTGRISERAEESFNRQSVPTVVSKEVGSVSFRLTKISYSFTLRKGKDYSLSPSFHGDSSSIQMGLLPNGRVFIYSTERSLTLTPNQLRSFKRWTALVQPLPLSPSRPIRFLFSFQSLSSITSNGRVSCLFADWRRMDKSMVRHDMPFISEVVASPRIILIESVEQLVSVEVEETIEELISQSTSSIAYRSTSD